MNIIEIKHKFETALSERNYLGMYDIVNSASESFVIAKRNDSEFGRHLIILNTETLEYLGASKKFESAYEMHRKLIENRIRIFELCLKDDNNLKVAFQSIIGVK